MSEASDRLVGLIERIVNRLLWRVDYYAAYPATVVMQAADGTLELKPDSSKIPLDVKVPIRGLPGVTVKVANGARVLIEWEGGDPKRPIATLFETRSLKELTITADTLVTVSAPSIRLADGDVPLARQGDAVKITLPTLISGSPGSPVTPLPAPYSLLPTSQVVGFIMTGSGKAKSG